MTDHYDDVCENRCRQTGVRRSGPSETRNEIDLDMKLVVTTKTLSHITYHILQNFPELPANVLSVF